MSRAKPPANDNRTPVGTYIAAPLHLPAFPLAQRVRGKNTIPGGGLRQRWKSRSGTIYEWDYQHGRVEVYDRRGRHLGEFDPYTGARTKPANPHYQVEP
ncbi:colicin-E3 [mine drainage metagenome]|uniref:Colicin-E3 n=1 Tax=mine drainage metagenome TaxID=410659 RepID=A0A1J5P2C1_9ZZZZ